MFITGAKKPAFMRFLRSRGGKIRSWLRQNLQLVVAESGVGGGRIRSWRWQNPELAVAESGVGGALGARDAQKAKKPGNFLILSYIYITNGL